MIKQISLNPRKNARFAKQIAVLNVFTSSCVKDTFNVQGVSHSGETTADIRTSNAFTHKQQKQTRTCKSKNVKYATFGKS